VGVQNVVANALSRRHTLLANIQMKVIGFETIKELYKDDRDFQRFWNATDSQSSQDYYRHDGLLFKRKTLCIPKYSLREAINWEAHDGGLT